MRFHRVLALTGALCGCGGDGESSGFGGMDQPGVITTPAGSESSAVGSSTGTTAPDGSTAASDETSAASTSTGTGDGTIWDMGVPDFGSPQPAGCNGKIDFLFVVSSGGTMKEQQDKLLAAFPEFIAAIEAQFAEFDLHILSANTDKSWKIEDCSLCTEGCDPQGETPYCAAEVTACDKKIGAGVVFPTGLHAANRRCGVDNGLRYITSGQQDLAEVFACTAQVGTHGGSISADAMVAALKPEFNDPRGEFACNSGFLRDDALLVVTIIEDGYDVSSSGTVDEWIDALRAAKHYDDDAFAVLVLTTDIDVGYHQLCHPNDFDGTKNRLRLLAEGVEHGFIDSICHDSYAPFFAEHVGALVELCEEFVPPG